MAKNISPPLHKALSFAVKAIDKFKASALNDWLLRQLFSENDETFERLLLDIKVRGPSRRNCLAHLFTTVVEFLGGEDFELKFYSIIFQ